MSEIENLRVLLVEDESLVAMLIEDALSDLNCPVVAKASTLDEALAKASSADFDVAILDVNLNGRQVYPVAELLTERKIPFFFSTGYGPAGIPATLRFVPVLGKPFNEGDIEKTLKAALTAKQ